MSNKIIYSYVFQGLTALFIVIRLGYLVLSDNSNYLGFYSLLISFLLFGSFFSQLIVNNPQIQKVIIENKMNINFLLPITLIINIILFNIFFLISSFSYDIYLNLLISIVVISIYYVVDLIAIVNNNLNLMYRNLFIQNIITTILIVFLAYNKIDITSLSYIPICSFILPVLFSKEAYKILFFPKISFIKTFKLIKENYQLSLVPPVNLALDYFLKLFISSKFGIQFLGDFQTIQSIESLTGNILLGPYYKSLLLNTIKKKLVALGNIILNVTIITLIPIIGLFIIIYLDLSFLDKLNELFFVVILVLISKYIINIWGAISQVLIAKGNHIFITKVEIFNKVFLFISFITLSIFISENLKIYPYSFFITSLVLLLIIIFNIKNLKSFYKI